MKVRLLFVGPILLCSLVFSQVPTVQLKIKERSGFLGMGGPRIVQLQLSNQQPLTPISSESVNSGEYYYFYATPVGDWKLEPEFVDENLSKVSIYQDGQTYPIMWRSQVFTIGNGGVVLGFSKSLKLYKLFLFQCPIEETVNQVEVSIPQEYWPGYTFLIMNIESGKQFSAAKQYRQALWYFEKIVADQNLKIFPQFDEVKNIRVELYENIVKSTMVEFENLMRTDINATLKNAIAQIDTYKPTIQFVIDSLPRPTWGISSLDPSVASVLNVAREALLRVSTVRDSLQQVLDERTIQWILTSSSTGKNGYLYQYIIETFAYAFASLPFEDTTITKLEVRISEDIKQRLVKNNLMESFETFIRVCNERFQMHLPIYPVGFLPNLRKDTASFSLPFYSMLKAVSDYYYGNWSDAKAEIFKVFRTCYETELNTRFDLLRVVIVNRESNITPDIVALIKEAQQAESKRDVATATEQYRQLTLIAPNFAYGYFLFARFYSRIGDVNRAIFYYQRAYQIDTLYLTAYRECYNSYLKLGNYKPMIEVMTTALSKGNNFWEIHYNLGTAYMGDGDLAKAIQHYEHALTLNPKSYKANLQLGLAYQNARNFQKAREYFNNAIGIDPTRQEAVDYLTKLNELQRMGK
ncbi:MAG: tetratricopeptide repeat protein [Bacteroidetes bacterium]|nr:tetratricopeptide repeat protein [Bacteroidota bacterium]